MNFLHVLYLMTGLTRNEILLTFFINHMYVHVCNFLLKGSNSNGNMAYIVLY